jgi:hypothetical protein
MVGARYALFVVHEQNVTTASKSSSLELLLKVAATTTREQIVQEVG